VCRFHFVFRKWFKAKVRRSPYGVVNVLIFGALRLARTVITLFVFLTARTVKPRKIWLSIVLGVEKPVGAFGIDEDVVIFLPAFRTPEEICEVINHEVLESTVLQINPRSNIHRLRPLPVPGLTAYALIPYVKKREIAFLA